MTDCSVQPLKTTGVAATLESERPLTDSEWTKVRIVVVLSLALALSGALAGIAWVFLMFGLPR
jgi:hypothetical protein